jgi:hypothetical protein
MMRGSKLSWQHYYEMEVLRTLPRLVGERMATAGMNQMTTLRAVEMLEEALGLLEGTRGSKTRIITQATGVILKMASTTLLVTMVTRPRRRRRRRMLA